MKKTVHVSFEVEAASRKKRKWCTICCSRQKSRCVDRVASHISTCAWIAAQKPGSTGQYLLLFAWFLLVDFSLTIVIDDATGHARSGAKKYRRRSRKKVSGRRFKTRSVGLVEAETFFVWPKEDCVMHFPCSYRYYILAAWWSFEWRETVCSSNRVWVLCVNSPVPRPPSPRPPVPRPPIPRHPPPPPSDQALFGWSWNPSL